jgi:hypothetical protein
MHDYPARIIHDDRIRTLRGEGAQARLAARPHSDASRLARGRARGWLRQAFGRTSAWPRRDALAHSLGGGLRPATDPQLAEDA